MQDIAELHRLIDNLVRTGIVAQVDLSARPAKVRVRIGALTGNWLEWVERRTGTTTTWNPPTVGEKVIVFCPGGDTAGGFALPGLNTTENPAPSASANENILRHYPDGARIAYDHAKGHLSVTGIKTAVVDAAGSITAKAPEITLDGNVTVTGLLTYQAGMAGKNGQGNATTISGNITHEGGNLTSNGITVHTHRHRAQGPDAITTGPLP